MQELIKGMPNASNVINANFKDLYNKMEASNVTTVSQNSVTGNVQYYTKNNLMVITVTHSSFVYEETGFKVVNLFTLPVHLRPKIAVYASLQTDNNDEPLVLEVTTAGVVSVAIRKSGLVSNDVAFRGTISFPI